MEIAVFVISAIIVVSGAIGVVAARNPVHAALFLVQTLFGVAVLFVLREAHFLAAVQVIVYAGAIVILFLFVIMLLGVDQADDLEIEPISGQRPLAVVIGAALLGISLTVTMVAVDSVTGRSSTTAALSDTTSDIRQIAEELFTGQVFAFELTALLLTIAVVGAVVLARKVRGELQPLPELPDTPEPAAGEVVAGADEVGADADEEAGA